MARMVPTPMLPVQSNAEEELYKSLHEQLPDDFTCYHGIEWLRLGGRPQEGEADFLIAHAELGVLVLEVKGGQLTYEPASRKWKRQGDLKPVKDPFAQAQRCMHWLMDELATVPKRWMPSLGYGVAFPNGEYREQAHPNASLDLVVDHRDMGELATRIPKLMRRWQRDDRPFGTDGMRALDQVLGYRVEVLVPLGSRIDEAERRTIHLTPEQSYVRDLLRRPGRFGVTGTAGSGKTIIAIETARWLAKQGHRTLVTCFNKRLATYLAASTAELELVHAVHFHELAYEVSVRAGLIEPYDPSRPETDNDPYFTHDLPAALAQAADTLTDRFDAIVVDEAQDFRAAYWDALLRWHATPETGPLYLFADDNQNIYKGAQLPLEPREMLPPIRTNMRNSREIQEFLAALYREVEGAEPPEVGGESHGPVRVVSYGEPSELQSVVRSLVDDLTGKQGVALSDIVLLTPTRAAKSVLRMDNRLGDLPLTEFPADGALLASSLQGFKGLERPVVILAELGERGDTKLVEYLYVGGSRARYQLILVATDELAARLRGLPGTEESH